MIKYTTSYVSSFTMSRVDTKAMLQPIDVLFNNLKNVRVQIWLFDQTHIRIEGQIKGFDEYMNIVLDNASEVNIKMKTRKNLGRILLKGDNVTLIQELN